MSSSECNVKAKLMPRWVQTKSRIPQSLPKTEGTKSLILNLNSCYLEIVGVLPHSVGVLVCGRSPVRSQPFFRGWGVTETQYPWVSLSPENLEP